MEILPLLQSNVLPTDVVLDNIYNHLWRIKSPLSNELMTAIENDHFRLKKIVLKYYNSRDFSRNLNHEDYFLHWLLNDIIGVMNDREMLMDGISENLKKECPWITMDYLLDDMNGKLNEKVYDLWKVMTPEKKSIMYELSVDI